MIRQKTENAEEQCYIGPPFMVLANPLQYSGRLENSLHSQNPLSLLADSSQSANVTDRCTDGFAVVYTELARKQSLSNKYSIGGGICVWT